MWCLSMNSGDPRPSNTNIPDPFIHNSEYCMVLYSLTISLKFNVYFKQ